MIVNNKVISKVFFWMFIGLLITFATGFICSKNINALDFIYGANMNYIILIIIELGLAIFLSARLHKMSPTTAKVSYVLYTFFSGLTFSSIFVIYKLESILWIFLIAAMLFLLFAIIGHLTKIDLTKFGTMLAMLLLGVIVCMLINMFVGNEKFDLVITIVSIVVFLGYIAYDIQTIKKLDGYLPEDNLAIYGAFQLYLDFINIFIELLKIFGKDND